MRSRFLYRFQNEGSWTWRSVRDQCPNLGVIQRCMSMDWFLSKDDIQLSHFFKRTGGRFSFDNHELDLLCQVPAIKIEEPARQLSAPSLGGTFWQSQHWRLQCIAGIEGQLEPSWLKDQDLWVTPYSVRSFGTLRLRRKPHWFSLVIYVDNWMMQQPPSSARRSVGWFF